MTEQDVIKWKPLAMEVSRVKARRRPVTVEVFEAFASARFLRQYWRSTEDLPGMEQTEVQVPLEMADDIESLARAVSTLDQLGRDYYQRGAGIDRVSARGRWLCVRLVRACDLVTSHALSEGAGADGHEPVRSPKDATRASRVEYMFAVHARAERLRPRLRTIRSFREEWIDELASVARELSSVPCPRQGRPRNPHMALRDRMLELLRQRVRRVRQAARLVFAEHPAVCGVVHSAFDRERKRREYRVRTERRRAAGDRTIPLG